MNDTLDVLIINILSVFFVIKLGLIYNCKDWSMCKIDLLPISLGLSENFFRVEADMFLKCKSVETNASYVFIPVLSDDNHRIELPIILVVGRRRFGFFDKSANKVHQYLIQDYKIHKIFKAVNGTHISHTYRIYLEYEKWMSNAKLSLIQMN